MESFDLRARLDELKRKRRVKILYGFIVDEYRKNEEKLVLAVKNGDLVAIEKLEKYKKECKETILDSEQKLGISDGTLTVKQFNEKIGQLEEELAASK